MGRRDNSTWQCKPEGTSSADRPNNTPNGATSRSLLPRNIKFRRGSPCELPLFFSGCLWLKSESQTKLQLAHAVRCVWGSIGFDGADDSASRAVDACVALGRVEAKDRMVEYVV